MHKLLQMVAAFGLVVSGTAMSLQPSEAQAQSWRGDRNEGRWQGDRDRRDYRRDDRRARYDRRDWRGRDDRWDRRGREDRWDRRGRDDRWDRRDGRRRDTTAQAIRRAERQPGYVDPRSQGDNTNYYGQGYRPCTYEIRNGRRVCR